MSPERHALRLKHIASITVSNVDKKSAEGQRAVRLCNYTDVYYNAAITSALAFMEATASESQINQFTIQPGDVLITKDSETPDDIAVPAYVEESLGDLLCGYHLAVIRPNTSSVYPKFLYWTLASSAVRSRFGSEATGVTRFGLRTDSIANAPILLPSRETQQRIADFLDRETARIDSLIEKKRLMIELLDERFLAFTKHVVLAGLDPVTGSAELPDSWQQCRLGTAITLHRGFDLPETERREGSVPVISSGARAGSHDTATCAPPGVVTGRYGTIGAVHFIDQPFWPLNTTLFVSDFRGNDAKWVYYLLRVLPLDIDAEKSAVTGINRNVVGALHVPLPPVEAQVELARTLDNHAGHHARLTAALSAQIDRLVEHRQALVAAAVTGDLFLEEAAV